MLKYLAAGLAAFLFFLVSPDASDKSPINRAAPPAAAQDTSLQQVLIERRARARLERLFRLAQKKSDRDRKSFSGDSKKSFSPPKAPAPRIRRKPSPPPAPKIEKKFEPPPVQRRRAPVIKKKIEPKPKPRPAPVQQQAPVKKAPPPPADVKKAPPPRTGPSDEQIKQNKDFCAKNPDSPKCGGAQEEPAPATEKICSVNPKYPGCDKLTTQPDLTPPEDAGRVPGLCEQNPQLPQCRPDRPDEADAPPGPPGFEPPDQPAPLPPTPPTPPPSGEPEPSGPQIQTVEECPEGQVSSQGECVDTCPAGWVAYQGACIIDEACLNLGRVAYEGECLAECPSGLVQLDVQCVAECPEGRLVYEGQCVAVCPAGTEPSGNTCEPCSAGQVGHDGACLDECPPYTVQNGNICEACPEGQVFNEGLGRCICDGFALPMGDACVPLNEIGYDEIVDYCLEGNLPLVEATEEACASVIEEQCAQFQEWDAGMTDQVPFCRELDTCPEGQTYDFASGQCTCGTPGEYSMSELPIGDACVPFEEVTYEQAVDFCLQVNSETGAASEESCAAQIAEACAQYQEQGVEEELAFCSGPPPGEEAPPAEGETEVAEGPGTGGEAPPEGEQQPPEGEQPPPAGDEEPPAGEQPPAEGQEPPPEEEQTPPAEGEQPPEESQPPPEGEQPPPTGDEEPPAGEQPPAEGQEPPPEGEQPPEEGQPDLTPPEDAGRVPDLCTQNPLLPNCQPDAPEEEQEPPSGGEQPPGEDQQPPEEEQPAPAEGQEPPAGEQPPAEETQEPEPAEGEQPPEESQPPPAEGQEPPPEEEQPPAEGEQPPEEDQPDLTPPEDAGRVPDLCTQNPRLPWCRAGLPDDGAQKPPQTGRPPPPFILQPPAPAPQAETKRPPAVPRIFRGPARRPLAVVVSNARYSVPGVPDNPHAKGGADAFTAYLREDVGLPRDRVIRLSDPRRDGMEAFFGKRGAAQSQLRAAIANARPAELIVYLSGHGLPVESGADAVLLPADGDPVNPARTGYRLSTLYENVRALGVRRVRFYIDAAFNPRLDAQPVRTGEEVRPVANHPGLGRLGIAPTRQWAAVTATTGNEPAYTDPDRPRSAFNEALIAGLRGEADKAAAGNRDRRVTAGELIAFAGERVAAAVKQATGWTQTPRLTGAPQQVLSTYRDQPAEPEPRPGPTEPVEQEPEPEPAKPVKPSFDCAKARAPAEKAICANPEVAALDNEMASLYYARRRALGGGRRAALTREQRQWLGRRNACGADVSCLVQVYRQRIRQLR